ncbi:hypothetical protein ABVT39_009946 [Epinephelus coioides]
MELVLVGCIGDVWEVLVRRRRRTGRFYLLLLCWLLAALTTAHGKIQKAASEVRKLLVFSMKIYSSNSEITLKN